MKSLIRILTKKKLKISFVESCTGGLLASTISSVNGASKILDMGLVTYSNRAKIKLLKISKNTITKYGAVSHECCLAMVNNLSKLSKSKMNISITGIAGPKGGSKLKPVGLVYIGVKKGKKIKIYKCLFKKKGRSSIQKATVKKALNLILRLAK